MQKKNLFRGTIILGLGGIISKILGFFFRIPLIYMIGEEGIGLYQLTYPLYSFILGISAGIPTALSKMISERIALNKQGEAHKIFKIAVYMMGIFGGISSLLIYTFSDRIITAFKWNSNAYYSLMGISLAPVFTCLLSAFKGYFQGMQLMSAPATSQVIEQLIRIISGVGLAYLLLDKGIAASAGGASFGAALGSMAGLFWMIYCFKKQPHTIEASTYVNSSKHMAREILRLAIPISLGQAIGSIMSLIDSIMVPGLLKASGYSEQLTTRLYGQLTGKAFVLVNIPLTLSIALAQTIVPAISESYAIKSRRRLEHNVRMSYKLAMIIALPCGGGLFILSKPILMLIFGGDGGGWKLLQVLSIASVFIIIAQTSTSIMNGIGKVMLPVITIFIGGIVKIFISLRFIPVASININAAAYGTLIAYGIVALIDMIFVVKSTKIRINIIEAFIWPGICTVVMLFVVILLYSYVDLAYNNNALSVMLSISGGGITYCLMLILTKTLKFDEMKRIMGK